MAIELTYHGHAALGLDIGGAQILIDPFFTDNPASTTDPAALAVDFILVSHGHSDHVGDTVSMAKRTGATVMGKYEVASWLSGKGVVSLRRRMTRGFSLWLLERASRYSGVFSALSLARGLFRSSRPFRCIIQYGCLDCLAGGIKAHEQGQAGCVRGIRCANL